jgi:murein DD-endopeptidase MepM/ murein hydrolase activator NlpD
MQQVRATIDDLRFRERALRRELARQAQALKDLRAHQADVQRALEGAARAERALRARLEREQRLEEYAGLVRRAQAAAHARARREAAAEAARARSAPTPPPNGDGASSGGGANEITSNGSWACPVQGAVSFTDTYGAPRSGGRSHKGVDMFAARGTPTVAVVAGSVFFQGDPLGGLAAYVTGDDGNTYYYAHLNDYFGGRRSVAAGEVIGHVGNTGDASDSPPHLHFEIRPGGPNGPRINPYTAVRAHC